MSPPSDRLHRDRGVRRPRRRQRGCSVIVAMIPPGDHVVVVVVIVVIDEVSRPKVPIVFPLLPPLNPPPTAINNPFVANGGVSYQYSP